MNYHRKHLIRSIFSMFLIVLLLVQSAGTVLAAYTSNERLFPGERVLSVVPVTTASGFHPSSGNSLEIRVTTSLPASKSAKIRIQILNSKDQWVYSKTYTGVNRYYFVKEWNGKPSTGNKAGLSPSKYVPSGTYKACICYFSASGTLRSRKTRVFTVNRTAPSGKTAMAQKTLKPVYVGYGCMDYLAEKMIKAAGVKSTDTVNAKIKKVYTYMLKNFKHVHDLYSRAEQYNISKMSSAISAYNEEVWKTVKNGRASFMYTSTLAYEQKNMIRRGGQCNDHAMIFMILMYHMGIPAGYCTGYYKNSNGTLAGHYWPFAIVNGVKYYYDIDIEIQNYGKGQGNYYWYKWSQAKADTKYIFNSTYQPGI